MIQFGEVVRGVVGLITVEKSDAHHVLGDLFDGVEITEREAAAPL